MGTCTGARGYSIPGEGVSVCPCWASWYFYKANYPICWEALPLPSTASLQHIVILEISEGGFHPVILLINNYIRQYLSWYWHLSAKKPLLVEIEIADHCSGAFYSLLIFISYSCNHRLLWVYIFSYKKKDFIWNIGEMRRFWRQWIQILYNFVSGFWHAST